MDASRLAEDLRQEQDHASQLERMRRNAETQVKELQVLYCHKLYKQWKYSLEMQSLVLLIYKCSKISLAGDINKKETKSKKDRDVNRTCLCRSAWTKQKRTRWREANDSCRRWNSACANWRSKLTQKIDVIRTQQRPWGNKTDVWRFEDDSQFKINSPRIM